MKDINTVDGEVWVTLLRAFVLLVAGALAERIIRKEEIPVKPIEPVIQSHKTVLFIALAVGVYVLWLHMRMRHLTRNIQ